MNTKGFYVNKILNLNVIFTLAFAVVFFFGVRAYADDAGDSSPAPLVLAPDTESVELYKIASEIKASTNTTMDLDDIYIILNDVRKVDPNGNIVWQVYDNVVDNDLNVLDSYSGEHLSVAQILYKSILGTRWDNPAGQIGLLDAMRTMWSTNHADQLAQMAKQQAIINALSTLDNNQRSDMLSLISALNTFKSANHSDITSFQNDFNNITWHTDKDYNIAGAANNLNDAVAGRYNVTLPYSSSTTDIYIAYDMPDYAQNYLAILSAPAFYQAPDIEIYLLNFKADIPYLYSSQTTNGQLIIYPIPQVYYGAYRDTIIVHYKGGTSRLGLSGTQTLRYLTYNDFDYYTVANTINSNHIDKDIHHQNTILDRFKDLYASDDLVAAKQAQQSVEDSAIADFSGNGSASMKGSDVTSAKNISNQVKDGLNAGGSVSNGLSAFSSNNAFWGWFSQDNANYFTVDVPISAFPQPILHSVRYQWTDDIPDVISSIDEEYYSKLGGE